MLESASADEAGGSECEGLQHEYRTLLKLNHCNVVRGIAWIESRQGDSHGFLMPLACGNLWHLVQGGSETLTRGDGVSVLVQVARGLSHVHMTGLVHLDMKPENVLTDVVTGHHLARLADFGQSVPGPMGRQSDWQACRQRHGEFPWVQTRALAVCGGRQGLCAVRFRHLGIRLRRLRRFAEASAVAECRWASSAPVQRGLQELGLRAHPAFAKLPVDEDVGEPGGGSGDALPEREGWAEQPLERGAYEWGSGQGDHAALARM